MKTKFLLLMLLALPFGALRLLGSNGVPDIDYSTGKGNGEESNPRSLYFSVSVQEVGDVLQIIFETPVEDADIVVTDCSGNVVHDEQQTAIFPGRIIEITPPMAVNTLIIC